MTFRLFLLTVLSLCAFLPALDTRAADLPASGEKALKEMILKTLYRHKEAYEKAGGTLGIEGELQIERTPGYYAVTLPRIIVTDASGLKGEIGMIALNATPGDKPGTWKMSVALPTPILYTAADGTPRTRIALGQQKISGVWHEKLGQFITLAAALSNLTIDDLAGGTRTVIADLTVASDLKEGPADHWSGTVQALGHNIETKQGKEPALSRIASANLQANITNLMAAEPAATGTDKNPPEEKDTAQAMPAWYDMIGLRAQGIKTQVALDGVSLNFPAVNGTPDTLVALDRLALGVNLQNAMGDNPSVGVTLALRNLTATPETDDIKTFAPRNASLDISLEKLPLAELSAFVQKTFLSGAATTPAARQIAALQSMLLLPQMFSRAGTSLRIKDTFLTNGTYNGLIEGAIAASDVSVIGVTGQIKAQLGGLDALQTALNQRLSTAKETDKPAIESALKKLAYIASLGREGTGTDGRKAMLYDFNIDDKGAMTLNGKDAATVLFGGGEGKNDASPPKSDTPKQNSSKPAP